MRHFIRILSSNFRANQREGIPFTGNSYPIWEMDEGGAERKAFAAWYLSKVYGYQMP